MGHPPRHPANPSPGRRPPPSVGGPYLASFARRGGNPSGRPLDAAFAALNFLAAMEPHPPPELEPRQL